MEFTTALYQSIFIIASFLVSGIFQVLWYNSSLSQQFLHPLDFGVHWRGKRLFGKNKTLRGLLVIIPATGISFGAFANLVFILPETWNPTPWEFSTLEYIGIGCCAGAGFMLGELPNSFIKRQLDIAPGELPTHSLGLKILISLTDRIDSILGALLVLEFLLPISWITWILVFLIGPGLHFLFSIWLFSLKIKLRMS